MPVVGPDGESIGAAAIQQRTAELNQQSAQMRASAQQLSAAAGTGFHLEPEAAAILIKSCQDAISELEGLDHHLLVISQAPKLGQTPAARVVAPFTQSVATDAQGIVPAIQNLILTLNAMEAAYRKASTNYQETEAIIADSLKKQQSVLPPAPAPRPQGRNRAM
jgi:hypothetical protein